MDEVLKGSDPSSSEGQSANHEFADAVKLSQIENLKYRIFDPTLGEGARDVIDQIERESDLIIRSLGSAVHCPFTIQFLSNFFEDNPINPDFNNFGMDFLRKHLPEIQQQATQAQDYGQKRDIHAFIIRLLKSGDPRDQQRVVESLQESLKHELSLPPKEEQFEDRKAATDYQEYLVTFGTIYDQGTDSQIIDSTQQVASCWDKTSDPLMRRHLTMVVSSMISGKRSDKDGLRAQASRELTDYILKDYGLDGGKLRPYWENYTYGDNLTAITSQNLAKIAKLEYAQQGIAKTLFGEFGIKLFHRYPDELLIDQYLQKDNPNLLFATMASSINDHNEVLAGPGMEIFLRSLFRQLKDNDIHIRVYDAKSFEETKAAFNRSKERYGQNNQIIGIIAGHGLHDRIVMAWSMRNDGSLITSADFADKTGWKFSDVLRKGGIVITISCHTGEIGGITQQMSEDDITTIGPGDETSIYGVKVTKNNSDIPDIKIGFDATKNVFRSGKLIESY